MAHHWHVIRMTHDVSVPPRDDYIDVDIFFALDKLRTTSHAAQVIADDIVANYPQAKSHPDLAKIPEVFADYPGSAFHYHPNYPDTDLLVGWTMHACRGNCRKTLRRFHKNANSHLARTTGLRVEDA